MRLLSVTVRNYRIHREVTVEFDPARTLIGGANETGKSTLVEAVHRALFLKATVTGEGQKGMVSNLYTGHPEVEVRFEEGGAVYRIAKRFSGSSGTATLSQEGGETWHKEAAEAKLHVLLGVEEVGGGRGAVDRAAGQWGHLWVKQGEGGSDPAAHANSQRDPLLAHLDKEGGAAVMESELDRKVAGQFAEAREALFVKAGSPRANSDLDIANRGLEAAGGAVKVAREKVVTLQKAVDDFASAGELIGKKTEELQSFAALKSDAEKRLGRVKDLRHREVVEESHAKQAVSEHAALVKADGEIAGLTRQIEEMEKALAPEEAETARLEGEAAARKSRREAAAAAVKAVDLELRAMRNRVELAKAWCERFESGARYDRLATEAAMAAKVRGEISELKSELARLAEVDAKTLENLKSRESGLREAGVALKSMASGVTVEAAEHPVRVGGERLGAGEGRIITEETEILVGDGTRLRISPGGGERLAEVREDVERRRRELEKALDDLAIGSVEEASRLCAQRQEIGVRLAAKQGELKARDADTVEVRLAEATAAKEMAEAEVERRAAMVEGGYERPADVEAAREWWKREAAGLDELGMKEADSRVALEASEGGLEQAEVHLKKHRKNVEETHARLRELRMRSSVQEENHGGAEARRAELEKLAGVRLEWEGKLAETRRELAELDPESLEADLARFNRAVERAHEEMIAARAKKEVAKTTLALDGTTDPAESLAFAEAEYESAHRRQISVERKAKAIRLLSESFSEQQRALAHRFTRPLAEKVTGYLRQLFGGEAEVGVELNEGKFERPVLTRWGMTYRFDELSGGTREQVAAGFRLAMAEILAADHGGCLPVVFDDAFTNSDPGRVQELQRMLDLGARRGLQVILLTCDPSGYAALGAKSVLLG